MGDPLTLHYLLSIVKPKGMYLVLESYVECLSKAVHVVDFSFKHTFEVGRRVTNDITVSDISVSRLQSKIQLVGNTVYMTDLDSKFGSFLLLSDLHPIGS
jgi:hypothetical protein